jgi:RNA polymerase sigma-70 factor (family 1)
LFAYVDKRLGIREQSEEIIQDVFVSLWTKRHTLLVSGELEPYLYGAVKKQMLQYFRKEGVRNEYAASFSKFCESLFDNSANEYVALNDLQQAIDTAVSQLPSKCAQVFWLSRRDHLTIADIALRMNISKKTVENYLTTALKHLRSTLGDFFVFVSVTGYILPVL